MKHENEKKKKKPHSETYGMKQKQFYKGDS